MPAADPDEEITGVAVPFPKQSGEHRVSMLQSVERRLDELKAEITAKGDPYDPNVHVYTYLQGYRDALTGRIPNVPKV